MFKNIIMRFDIHYVVKRKNKVRMLISNMESNIYVLVFVLLPLKREKQWNQGNKRSNGCLQTAFVFWRDESDHT